MGADIHCYIEYRHKRQSDNEHWSSFGGHINPGRNYELFGKIAGVRSGGQMFPLRGLPSPLGYKARGDYEIFVVDHETDLEGHVSRDDADRWVANGSSRYTDERKVFVTDPDAHSMTWLSSAEWRAVLESGPFEWGEPDVDYFAMLAAMDEIERRGHTARVVIWFDC